MSFIIDFYMLRMNCDANIVFIQLTRYHTGGAGTVEGIEDYADLPRGARSSLSAPS